MKPLSSSLVVVDAVELVVVDAVEPDVMDAVEPDVVDAVEPVVACGCCRTCRRVWMLPGWL